jgi:hypothetical protein
MFRAFLAVLATSLAMTGSNAGAQDPEVEFFVERGFLHVHLDTSHDLVHITVDGDQVDVQVMMFAQADFTQIPETWDTELLEDLATRVRHHHVDIAQITGLHVGCGSGHDVVWTHPDFPLVVWAEGSGGDDVLYGGAAGDILDGGEGSDCLYGAAGDDDLIGGNKVDYLYGGEDQDYLDGSRDGYRDVLYGGTEADELVQYQRLLKMGTRGRTLWDLVQDVEQEELLRDLSNEDILVLGQ